MAPATSRNRENQHQTKIAFKGNSNQIKVMSTIVDSISMLKIINQPQTPSIDLPKELSLESMRTKEIKPREITIL